MADYKQLCAELLADYEQHLFRSVLAERAALAEPEPERAINWPAYFVRQAAVQEQELKAALTEPEPVGPTAMEIIELAGQIEESGLGQVDLVRAALARWGNNTSRSNFDV